MLISRLHITPLVGYLLAVLGLALFNYEPGVMMDEIAHLGIIFLLFTVGLHIRIQKFCNGE